MFLDIPRSAVHALPHGNEAHSELVMMEDNAESTFAAATFLYIQCITSRKPWRLELYVCVAVESNHETSKRSRFEAKFPF